MSYSYEYNLKDHLGNTRVTFTGHANGRPEVNQLTSYDPYGLVTSQTSFYPTGASKNKLLYNGKEIQDDVLAGTKIDWFDYGARFYDPEIGRWHSVDLLAEKNYDYSPYNYVGSNPIKRVDLLGLDWYTDTDGTYQYDPNVNKNTKLKDGQTYVGRTYQVKDKNGKTTISYRRDGSIQYINDGDAIERVKTNAERNDREQLCVINEKGALVLPEYKNTREHAYVEEYGYSIIDGKLADPMTERIYDFLATIHSHNHDPMADNTPSTYTGKGYGDLGYMAEHAPGKLFMTIGHNGGIYGYVGKYNSKGIPEYRDTGINQITNYEAARKTGLIAILKFNQPALTKLVNSIK